MAINCVNEFDNPANEVISLQPNTDYIGTVASAFEGDYYKFEMFENETMTFNVAPRPNTPSPINMELTLYRKDGAAYTELGTSFITQNINQFIYDGVPGEYYFCLTTDYDIDYTLSVEFTDYPFSVLGEFIGGFGSTLEEFEFAKKATSCDSPVFYTLESGELPVGMELLANGTVQGIPLEQDCYCTEDEPPTFTWYEEDEETGLMKPITKDYVFTVRAALLDAPATFSDRTFKICVHNNWSADRDNFIEQSANFVHVEYVVDTGEPIGPDIPVDENGFSINGFVVLDEDGSEGIKDIDPVYDDKGVLMTNEPYGLPDINGLKKINPVQTLPVPEVEQIQELSEEELAAMCEICLINPEYQEILTINKDKHCVEVICNSSEEESTQPVIEEIDAEFCDPCAEPVAITGLQILPATMCDVCVPEEIPIPKVTKYNKKITYCTDEFINKMNTQKICDAEISCPVTEDVYPEIEKEPDLPTLPSSMCEETCEKD
jgi:hypothetical protein